MKRYLAIVALSILGAGALMLLLRPWKYALDDTGEWLSRREAVRLLTSGSYRTAHILGAGPFNQTLLCRNIPGKTGPFRDLTHLRCQSLPAFNGLDIQGRPVHLHEQRNRVQVLNLWFTSCGPCRVEIPALNSVVASFRHEPVDFVALALDPPAALQAFLTTTPFDYRQVPEADAFFKALGVPGAPVHIIVDPQGQIDSVFWGISSELVGDVLKDRVRTVLAASPNPSLQRTPPG